MSNPGTALNQDEFDFVPGLVLDRIHKPMSSPVPRLRGSGLGEVHSSPGRTPAAVKRGQIDVWDKCGLDFALMLWSDFR